MKKLYFSLFDVKCRFTPNKNESKQMLTIFQDWTLQIKYVQMRDGGQYECQVTKHPPVSIFLTLNVVGKHHRFHRFLVQSENVFLGGKGETR